MSYRDPQQAIDKRYQNLANGLSSFFSSVNKTIDQYTTREKAKKAKSRAILEKEIGGLEEEYQKGYSKVKNEANQFTTSLGEEEGVAMSQQIEDALVSMGRDLRTQIQNAGGADASAATIRSLKNNMTLQMDNLYNDIVNFEAARIEYEQVKHLEPYQENAILPGYNDGLIHMFEASQNNTKNNIMLSLDPKTKHWRMSLVDYKKDGSYKIEETLDVSDWSTKHTDKDYFMHVEGMGRDPYKPARDRIKDVAEQFKDENGVINREELINSLSQDDILSTYYLSDENVKGHWRTLGRPGEGETWEDYDKIIEDNPEVFLKKIVNNAIGELGNTDYKFSETVVEDPEVGEVAAAEVDTEAEAEAEADAAVVGEGEGEGTGTTTPGVSDTLGIFTAEGVANVASIMQRGKSATGEPEEEKPDSSNQVSQIIFQEVEFGLGNTGIPAYEGKEELVEDYLISDKQLKMGADGKGKLAFYGAKDNENRKEKKGLKTDIGANVYDGLSNAEQLILRTEHFNIHWDPRVLLLQTAGMLGDKTRKTLHNDSTELDELWNSIDKAELTKALEGKDQLMLDNLKSIYENTSGNQVQYKKRIEYLAKELGLNAGEYK